VLRLTGKLRAQLWILCGDANWAGVDYITRTVRKYNPEEDGAQDLR
jgi:hypothetical protein